MKKIILTVVSVVASVGIASAHLGEDHETAQAYDYYGASVNTTSKTDLQPAGTATDYKAVQSGSVEVKAVDTASGLPTGRVLPTVNKVDNIGSQGSDGVRVLPTVNKIEVTAPRDAASGLSTGRRIQVGDLDGDGKADFVEYEVKSPRDSASGQASGKREASAPSVSEIVITKIQDSAAVQGDVKSPRDAASGQATGKRSVSVTVRGWDPDKKEAIVAKIAGTIATDENIANAEVSEKDVKVAYRRNAKLFGFVPVAYQHAFTLDDKGNVANGRPWWMIFASSDASAFGNDVSFMFQNNQTNLEFLKTQDTMNKMTQAFQTLSNVLKTKHDTAKNSVGNIR